MFVVISNLVKYVENAIVDYIDLDFTLWLTWILTPLVITFLLPLIIVLLLYLTALTFYIYKLHRHRLRHAYETDFRDGARKTASAIWDAHGWIWHGSNLFSTSNYWRYISKAGHTVTYGHLHPKIWYCKMDESAQSYEVCGMENIPDDTPALIVYYHGAIPIDFYYLIAKTILFKDRVIHTVADRFLFKMPGFSIISEVMNVIPGTVQICSNILKENNLLAIAPGGVYESQFSNSYYTLMWKKRLGFAKVALDAKVPVIPIFTENVREAFRSVSFGKSIWLKLYTIMKFPIVPIYGGFPVKLRTHVGKPIPYNENLTPEQLQIKVARAIEELIEEHQRIPGSIMRALVQRVYQLPKKKSK